MPGKFQGTFFLKKMLLNSLNLPVPISKVAVKDVISVSAGTIALGNITNTFIFRMNATEPKSGMWAHSKIKHKFTGLLLADEIYSQESNDIGDTSPVAWHLSCKALWETTHVFNRLNTLC